VNCIQCDNKFSEKQYNSFMSMCNECSGKQRYSMEVEFKHPILDYGVFLSDTWDGVLKDLKEAKKNGYHPDLGACPEIRMLKIVDNFNGEVVIENEKRKNKSMELK